MKTKITLSIPKEALLKAKLPAVKRQTSISGLLTQTLERLVQQQDAYARGRNSAICKPWNRAWIWVQRARSRPGEMSSMNDTSSLQWVEVRDLLGAAR